MGVEKFNRPVWTPGVRSGRQVGWKNPYTIKSTATVLPGDGLVVLDTTAVADHNFRLPNPKNSIGSALMVTVVDSSHVLGVTTLTTAATFFNSTKQTISFSTASDRKVVEFRAIGPSTNAKWMVVTATTGATIA